MADEDARPRGGGSSLPGASSRPAASGSDATRLDRSPWRPMHTRIALALGVGWALDGVGASVAVGRVGAIIGTVGLGLTTSAFGLTSGFLLLSAFWAIGAVAAAIWLVRGVEARGVPLELLAEA